MKTLKLVLVLVIFGWFTYVSFEELLELTDSRKIASIFSPIIGIVVTCLFSIDYTLNDINNKLK